MTAPGPGTYTIRPEPFLHIVGVTEAEADELGRTADRLAARIDDAAAAAGPGSPVAGALAEFRGRHDEVAREHRGTVERAATGAREVVAAYEAADGEMAGQYGVPVPPAPPVVPDLVDVLRRTPVLLPIPLPFPPR